MCRSMATLHFYNIVVAVNISIYRDCMALAFCSFASYILGQKEPLLGRQGWVCILNLGETNLLITMGLIIFIPKMTVSVFN